MPRPLNERQSLEMERDELLGQVAAYRQESENAPVISKTRRDFLEWHIRRVQKRMADVEAGEDQRGGVGRALHFPFCPRGSTVSGRHTKICDWAPFDSRNLR